MPAGQKDETSGDHGTGLPVLLSLRRESMQNGHRETAADNSIIYISWQTKAEVNTLHFELQRSVNGKHYKTVETIMAMGNSRTVSRYITSDNSFIFYGLYYRLKLVFTNGREMVTDPVMLRLNSVAGATVHDLTYNRNNQ
jgi:hypothetical protein